MDLIFSLNIRDILKTHQINQNKIYHENMGYFYTKGESTTFMMR